MPQEKTRLDKLKGFSHANIIGVVYGTKDLDKKQHHTPSPLNENSCAKSISNDWCTSTFHSLTKSTIFIFI
jgi:hypothetical protein